MITGPAGFLQGVSNAFCEEVNKMIYRLLTYEGKPPYYTGPRQNLAGYHKTAKFVRMVMFFDEIVYIASPCQYSVGFGQHWNLSIN